MDFFKPKKIKDISELKAGMAVRWTTRIDNHPMKKSARWFLVEQNDVYKNNGVGGLILGYKVDQTDNYSRSKHLSITVPTNEWLLDTRHDVDIFTSAQYRRFMFDESMLCHYLSKMEAAGVFHDSNFFKFDIDGYERTESDYRFSHFKSLFSNKHKVEYGFDGKMYISQDTLHRPFALKIAKYVNPRILDTITGDSVEITHITELGDLIYDINGLKSIDKIMLKEYYTDRLEYKHDLPKFCDSLEECISGDIPQYRQNFSFSIADKYKRI